MHDASYPQPNPKQPTNLSTTPINLSTAYTRLITTLIIISLSHQFYLSFILHYTTSYHAILYHNKASHVRFKHTLCINRYNIPLIYINVSTSLKTALKRISTYMVSILLLQALTCSNDT